MGCGRACNALISCIWLHEPAGIFVSNHLGPHLIDWWMLSAFSTVMDCQASPKSFSRLSTHVVESMQLVFNYRCIQLEAGNRSCMICSVCKVHFSVTYIIYLSVQCMSGSWLLKQHGGHVDSIRVLCPAIGNNPVPSAVERDIWRRGLKLQLPRPWRQ